MPFTCSQALSAAPGLGLDRLDSQLLLLHVLGKHEIERAWLVAHDDEALDDEQAAAFHALVLRRAAGEPLAYLVGYKEFFGLRFSVDARVLVPRPDTETLVQWALDTLQTSRTKCPSVLDLGTGSGAVAVAVARNALCNMTAVDASEDALAVATSNAKRLGAHVTFLRSNWFAGVSGRFDCIVSNPPYIADDDLHLAALKHEPLSALVAGADGLNDIRAIAKSAADHLKPNGWLLLEHGYDQASAVCELLAQHGFEHVQSRDDLSGISRCSGGQWLK
jgi:release factor glutamine methyltransferase